MKHIKITLFVVTLASCGPKDKGQTTPIPLFESPVVTETPEVRAKVVPPVAGDLALYAARIPGTGPLIADLETSMGTFHCRFFEEQSPATVANFVGLATGFKPWLDPTTKQVQEGKPYYDGLIFHRVIPEFMIQGGDPLGTGEGGPGYEFANEVTQKHNTGGVLSMANAGPDTNGSQFFITEQAVPRLDGNYSVFGTCDNTELVAQIARVPAHKTRPISPVTLTRVLIHR